MCTASVLLSSFYWEVSNFMGLLDNQIYSEWSEPLSGKISVHIIILMRRGLTYLHLAVFSWLQLVLPARLSYDWQLGSIPLVSGLADPRNLLTLAAGTVLVSLGRPAVSNRPAAFGLLFLVLVSGQI